MKKIKYNSLVLLLGVLMTIALNRCDDGSRKTVQNQDREPVIVPDYSGVVIPPNIAPMNFTISENGESFEIKVTSSNGTSLKFKSGDKEIRYPLKAWKKLLASVNNGKIKIEISSEISRSKVIKFKPFYMNVAGEPIDPYLCYRTLYPGYETWGEMKVIQRSVEDFKEYSLIENQVLENNCINCHTFNKNSPDKFLIHVRGSNAGTYFVDNKTVTRKELRTKEMPGNAVYPAWHPTGKYVAFSSNMIFSVIHMRPERNIELYDRYSILVIYDIENNEISACRENYKGDFMETYPFWSTDGEYLYYCRTGQIMPGFDFTQIKYDLVRMPFDMESGKFGDPEVIFNARELNKSVSLPTISPDGRYSVFTLHDYGTFPGWHKEADLYSLDLQNGNINKLSLNSVETESYNSWSSNGRWLVFSSKRDDGFTSRPYIAYFYDPDSIGKPFILPQKDPLFYRRFEKSINRPEFVTGKIKTGPRYFIRASKKESVKAVWSLSKGLDNTD